MEEGTAKPYKDDVEEKANPFELADNKEEMVDAETGMPLIDSDERKYRTLNPYKSYRGRQLTMIGGTILAALVVIGKP